MFGFFKKKNNGMNEDDVFYIKLDYDKMKDFIKSNYPAITDNEVDDIITSINDSLSEKVREKRVLEYDEFIDTVSEEVSLTSLNDTRLGYCKKIDNFIKYNTEALNSVRIYANTICYGSSELKLDEYRVVVTHESEEIVSKALSILRNFEKRSKIKRVIYLVAKDVVKYGDGLLEKIKENGKIVNIGYLPSNSFYFDIDEETGEVRKFYQILNYEDKEDVSISYIKKNRKNVIEFEPDEVVLFSDGTLPGDVDSPLYSLVEVWFNLKLIEESLVIHRISRAKRLLVFFLDVTGKTRKKIQQAISNFTAKLKSIFNIKVTEGDIYSKKLILKQGNDIVIPITRNSATKVYPIEADTSAIQIDDIKFYHSKIIRNMLTSFIFEEANGTEKYMEKAFIKVVRTLQKQFAYALEDLYNEILEQNGINDCEVSIIFPSPDIDEEVKLVDTIMRRMMIVSQLTAVVETKIPIEWVVKYIFKDLTQPELLELINLITEAKRKMEDQEYPSIVESVGEEQEEVNEVNEYINLTVNDLIKEQRIKSLIMDDFDKILIDSKSLNNRIVKNIKIVSEYLKNTKER